MNANDPSTGQNIHIHECPIHGPLGIVCSWWRDHDNIWRTLNKAQAVSNLQAQQNQPLAAQAAVAAAALKAVQL